MLGRGVWDSIADRGGGETGGCEKCRRTEDEVEERERREDAEGEGECCRVRRKMRGAVREWKGR